MVWKRSHDQMAHKNNSENIYRFSVPQFGMENPNPGNPTLRFKDPRSQGFNEGLGRSGLAQVGNQILPVLLLKHFIK